MARFIFKELATSSGLNTKTLLKTEQNEVVTGTFDLNDANNLSGDSVLNTQKAINKASTEVYSSLLSNGNQIILEKYKGKQVFLVEGNGAAALLSTTPFDLTSVPDDCEIILIGQNNTNTVRINHNDATNGCLLNGDATLKRGFTLTLFYVKSLNRFIELSRNF